MIPPPNYGTNFLSPGVKGNSSLVALKSIEFPDSVPIDVMHSILQNFGPLMWNAWCGQKKLHVQWSRLGEAMAERAKLVPPSFGRSPSDILKYSKSWKAEEWKNWILLYSVPMLLEFSADSVAVEGWVLFVRACRLIFSYHYRHDRHGAQLRNLLSHFHAHLCQYYREFNLWSVNTHYLFRHLTDSLASFGPAWGHWQFPMERVCGQLMPVIRNRSSPYANLANQVLLRMQMRTVEILSGGEGCNANVVQWAR